MSKKLQDVMQTIVHSYVPSLSASEWPSPAQHIHHEKRNTRIVINQLTEFRLAANLERNEHFAMKWDQRKMSPILETGICPPSAVWIWWWPDSDFRWSMCDGEWIMWWVAPESIYETEEGLVLPEYPMAEKEYARELCTICCTISGVNCLFDSSRLV